MWVSGLDAAAEDVMSIEVGGMDLFVVFVVFS